MDDRIYENKHSEGMATASLILGIAGLATACCFYPGIICGALAIIFAILSRGGGMTIPNKARVGLGLGIAAIALLAMLFAMVLLVAIIESGGIEAFIREYRQMYQEIYNTYYNNYYNGL